MLTLPKEVFDILVKSGDIIFEEVDGRKVAVPNLKRIAEDNLKELEESSYGYTRI